MSHLFAFQQNLLLKKKNNLGRTVAWNKRNPTALENTMVFLHMFDREDKETQDLLTVLQLNTLE